MNQEFNDALDELRKLHDKKNHDYATDSNPYENLEAVREIGIEPWRGVVIRLMDKFKRVKNFCDRGELKVNDEKIEATFMDIAVYSTLALILFRKEEKENKPEWSEG